MNRAERYYRRFRDSDDPDLVLEDAYAAGSVWSSTVFVGGKKYNSVVLTYLDGSKITICEQYNMRDQILITAATSSRSLPSKYTSQAPSRTQNVSNTHP